MAPPSDFGTLALLSSFNKKVKFTDPRDEVLYPARNSVILSRCKEKTAKEEKEEKRYKRKLRRDLEKDGYDNNMLDIILAMPLEEITLFVAHVEHLRDNSHPQIQVYEEVLLDSSAGANFFNRAMFAMKEDVKKIDAALSTFNGPRR